MIISEKIYLTEDKKASLEVIGLPMFDQSRSAWQAEERPVAVIVPGGSYLYCSDREAYPVGLTFASKGYQVFILRYHVGDESDYPRPFLDLSLAIKYIKENKEKYKLDINNITIAGFSAGGHLVGTYAGLVNRKEFHEISGMDQDQLKVKNIILGYPAVNLKPIAEKINHYNIHDKVGKLFTTYDEIKDGKALAYNGMANVFVFHSIDDDMVYVNEVADYVHHLTTLGVNVEFHLFNQGGHGYSTGNKFTNPKEGFPTRVGVWMDIAFDWLDSLS